MLSFLFRGQAGCAVNARGLADAEAEDEAAVCLRVPVLVRFADLPRITLNAAGAAASYQAVWMQGLHRRGRHERAWPLWPQLAVHAVSKLTLGCARRVLWRQLPALRGPASTATVQRT